MTGQPIIKLNLKAIVCKIRGYHRTVEYHGRETDWFCCLTCSSAFYADMDKCRFPRFNLLVKKCKTKMKETFPKYGNSWRFERDFRFWKKRLQGEIDEIWKAETKEQFEKEIIDAINVLSMIHENSESYHPDLITEPSSRSET
ncbi:MAG: hypothetical protein KGI08_10870 [Thaumarchaeota archaeon]|nr:hypothetical protein [Nitrososphaerota archaeon]